MNDVNLRKVSSRKRQKMQTLRETGPYGLGLMTIPENTLKSAALAGGAPAVNLSCLPSLISGWSLVQEASGWTLQ